MRYSQIFGKTSKTAPGDADSLNARLLTQGGFIHKQMAGVYSYLPLGLKVLTKIQNIIREEINKLGANEILMPSLTQEENYIKTNRNNLDILFHLLGRGDSKLVLNLSHEEVVTPLVQSYAFSYRDLPIAVYQIQNKFRDEPRAKSGLLRGREFNMKDLYSFHATTEDLDTYYDQVIKTYFNIYERLGLGDRTVLTYSSGGSFSKYSHEFQALCDIGEDTIYLCEKCKTAVNKEIIEEQNTCPNCLNVDLTEKKAIEVGNIFKLGARFTEAFKFNYQDANGKLMPVTMGCYGLGPSRIMGALVEIFNDSKGIIWPESVAPFSTHLIVIGEDETVRATAEKIYAELIKQNQEVLYDDRQDVSAGAKFNDADLLGIPSRVIVSAKTCQTQSVEIKSRSATDSKLVLLNEFLNSR